MSTPTPTNGERDSGFVALLERFQAMDRRWVFLGMALAIFLPMVFPVKLGFKVDERVQAVYDAVDALPAGSTVLYSADFDPASRPELEPFYRANLDHLFRNDVKVVMLTLWEFAPPLAVPILDEIAARHGKEYGKDYVFLGYKPGKELAIKAIGENIPKTFPKDTHGTPVDDLPIMQGFRQAKDFPMLINVSAGFPGTREYVLQIQGQYNLNIVSSTTAVSAPDYIPFYKAGQLVGLAGGMPGSAQYEKLVYPDGAPEGVRLLATQAINVLNLGHLYIIVLIFLGNVAWLLTRRPAVGADQKQAGGRLMDPVTTVTTAQLLGAWISIFLTLCIFSFLYDDNPVYKLAEHIFLGVSIGISITEIWKGVFKPNLVDKLLDGNVLSVVPLLLVGMLFMKVTRKWSYLARLPIAFIVAAYAGVKLTGEANANLMTQVAQSMPDLATLWTEHGLWDWSADGAGVISGLVLVLGLSACLLHFYFSAPHSKPMQVVSRFGVLVLMLSFGASFGYTVMGRISLAIGRAQEMLGLDKPAVVAEQIHPQIASVVSALLVIGFLVAWRVRQQKDQG